MKIIQLTAENVKRLHAVTITPTGNVIEVAGRNEQGKSSVLDSIWYALGGEGSHPPEPIRHGEKSASIKIDLGELRVTRTWARSGKSYLTVENADGSRPKSPQTLLNELVGKLSFDPLVFVREKPADQRLTLIRLLGLETKLQEINTGVKQLRDARKKDADALDRLRIELASQAVVPAETPDEPVDVVALSAEVERVNTENEANKKRREELAASEQKFDGLMNRDASFAKEIEQLRRQIANLEQQRNENIVAINLHRNFVEARRTEVAALHDADAQPIRDRIAAANATNAAVARKKRIAEISAAMKTHSANVERFTDDIKTREAERVAMLEGAEYPVPGLAFDDNGLTYNGLPFEQASQSVRLRVSIAIGMKLNPKLRVITIREGDFLDDEALASLYEQMREHDFQLWIERVRGGDGAILIEDGRIVGDVATTTDEPRQTATIAAAAETTSKASGVAESSAPAVTVDQL